VDALLAEPDIAALVAAHPRSVVVRAAREDAAGAAAALHAVAVDPELRRRLIEAGNEYAARRTAAAEIARVAGFLGG
jgi:hypothetical protein